jgi:hypothetical protein
MKAFHAKRLLKLADFLDALPRESFNLATWFRETDCGTVACAAGWACTIPAFKRAGLRIAKSESPHHAPQVIPTLTDAAGETYFGFDACAEFFGLLMGDSYHLFGPDEYRTGRRTTPKAVAKRIRAIVSRRLGSWPRAGQAGSAGPSGVTRRN